MKIAIVGGGISGLVCAHLLEGEHEVTLYEKNDWLGGHAHTVPVELGGRCYWVDTGFVVYNESNYPRFTELLRELRVSSRPTSMGFGLRCDRSGIEYATHTPAAIFAQRRNLTRPWYWRLWADVVRFYREAPGLVQDETDKRTLGELVTQRYSEPFAELHLFPMVASIWSIDLEQARELPASLFVRFFQRHGLFELRRRPRWRVIEGGSRSYVDALHRRLAGCVRLSSPVRSIRREAHGVVISGSGFAETCDHVILACHSDESLAMLDDPTSAERAVLGRLRYQQNGVVLHTDASLLPRNPRARSSWNYHLSESDRVTLTYSMNRLQGLDAPEELCVTLNEGASIDPRSVIDSYRYAHPVYDLEAMSARAAHGEISGIDRTHYCGAYWYDGFHEDGVESAYRVCHALLGKPTR